VQVYLLTFKDNTNTLLLCSNIEEAKTYVDSEYVPDSVTSIALCDQSTLVTLLARMSNSKHGGDREYYIDYINSTTDDMSHIFKPINV